jgi:hypothetical protein
MDAAAIVTSADGPVFGIHHNPRLVGGSAMNASLDPETQHQIDRMVNDLCLEFDGQFARAQIEEVMNDSLERVLGGWCFS